MIRRPRRAHLRYVAEDASSGYGDAGDRLVQALRGEGVRVEYRGWSTGGAGEPRAGIRRHSRDPYPRERAARDAPTVAHLVAERLPVVRRAISSGPFVVHTVWETDHLPWHWPELLNRTDRVIVPTEWNRQTFVASGVTAPLVVVPHVVCDPVPGDGGVPLGLPDDAVVFYTIGRWDQRKMPGAVIRAFLDAFTKGDPVALVVKTSPHAQFPAPGPWGTASQLGGTTMLEVARIVRDYPRAPLVRVEVADWEPMRLAGLHTRGDCYVSLSHGEGWGLGAFDAAAYGNPVVMTGWGGQLEYLDEEHSYLVDHDVAPARYFDERVYTDDQHWAVPSHEHAVELLREVAADPDAARRRVAPVRDGVLRDYAPARVVATLRASVPELELPPDPALPPGAVPKPTPAAVTGNRGAADELVLVGVAVGPWRTAFDNWVDAAERHGYRYELLGQDLTEPFERFATKWRVLRDYFTGLPRDRLVFHLDVADAFVCDGPATSLERYRSYGVPLVMGAEQVREGLAPNSGGYVGEAGVIADALQEGYELADWQQFGHVSDQHAMRLYLRQDGHRHAAVIDDCRVIVQNIPAAERSSAYVQHLALRERGEIPRTSSVHFYGSNGYGYNAFARLYGLRPVDLGPTGLFADPEPVR